MLRERTQLDLPTMDSEDESGVAVTNSATRAQPRVSRAHPAEQATHSTQGTSDGRRVIRTAVSSTPQLQRPSPFDTQRPTADLHYINHSSRHLHNTAFLTPSLHPPPLIRLAIYPLGASSTFIPTPLPLVPLPFPVPFPLFPLVHLPFSLVPLVPLPFPLQPAPHSTSNASSSSRSLNVHPYGNAATPASYRRRRSEDALGRAIFSALDREKAELLEDKDPEVTCLVCMVELDVDTECVRCIKCVKTIGCLECIMRWIEYKRREDVAVTCPNCRALWRGEMIDGPSAEKRRKRHLLY